MAKKIEVELALQDKLSKRLDRVRGNVARFGDRINSLVKKFINLKNAALAYVAIRISKYMIDAASSVEVFGKQLEMVTANAKEAGRLLDAIREFARTSPLETEDVVQSYIRLRAVGIEPTMKQMKILGGVAVLMDRKLVDMLGGFIGLHKRTLRRLGIDIDRTGKMAVIQSGNIRKVVEKDNASIRTALLEMWEERFPNAIEVAAKTTKAQTAIMKSNVFELAVGIGDKLKPAWEGVINAISRAAEATIKLWNLDKKEEKIRRKKIKILETEIEKQGAILTKQKIILATMELSAKMDIDAYNKKLIYATAIEDVIKKNKEILKQLKEYHKLSEKGTMGTAGFDEEAAEAAKKAADAAADAAAKEKERLEKKLENIKNTMTMEMDWIEWEFDYMKNMKDMDVDRTKSEIKNIKERMAAKDEEIKQAEKNLAKAKRDKDERIALDKWQTDTLVSSGLYLHNTLMNLARQSTLASKKEARKKRNILYALAIADAAAAAVKGIYDVWRDSKGDPWYKIAMTAIVAAEIIAATATQISSIKSAALARGTSYAGGGSYLVGEEGPERVNIPRGSQVYTAAQTRNYIGGNTISPTIIIQGNADSSTVEKIENTLQNFAKNFNDAKRHGYLEAAMI